jgi:glucan 1,3-beta-glucosidase
MSAPQHVKQVCRAVGSYTGSDKWTFIGEWSAAMTDCARHLNGISSSPPPPTSFRLASSPFSMDADVVRSGYGIGARFDGSRAGATTWGICAEKRGPVASWASRMKDDTRWFIEAQMDAFEHNTEGWMFWTAKTEGAGEWDLLDLLDNGVFPEPVTARKFPQAC